MIPKFCFEYQLDAIGPLSNSLKNQNAHQNKLKLKHPYIMYKQRLKTTYVSNFQFEKGQNNRSTIKQFERIEKAE